MLDKIKNEEMRQELNDYTTIHESIFTGNIIKRQLYYKERSTKERSTKEIKEKTIISIEEEEEHDHCRVQHHVDRLARLQQG